MKLEIKYDKNWKKQNSSRLNNMLLNNQWVNEKREKKFLETNESEKTTFRNQWDAEKAVVRGKFVAT